MPRRLAPPAGCALVSPLPKAPVAQWIERCPPEAEAAGSNPAGCASRGKQRKRVRRRRPCRRVPASEGSTTASGGLALSATDLGDIDLAKKTFRPWTILQARDGHPSVRSGRLPAVPGADREILERAKGFEPSTPTLARLCSTPELRPRSGNGRRCIVNLAVVDKAAVNAALGRAGRGRLTSEIAA